MAYHNANIKPSNLMQYYKCSSENTNQGGFIAMYNLSWIMQFDTLHVVPDQIVLNMLEHSFGQSINYIPIVTCW